MSTPIVVATTSNKTKRNDLFEAPFSDEPPCRFGDPDQGGEAATEQGGKEGGKPAPTLHMPEQDGEQSAGEGGEQSAGAIEDDCFHRVLPGFLFIRGGSRRT